MLTPIQTCLYAMLFACLVSTTAAAQTTSADRTSAAGSSLATDSPSAKVLLTTTLGTIVLELDHKKAPITVENFLDHVRKGYYDGTIFHRVIANFMIQGGGFDQKMNKKPTSNEPIQNEADNGLPNVRGSIAMARTGEPHSANAQFFINVVDNDTLNHRDKSMRGWGYAVFGKVIEGMDTVDKIRAVKTGPKPPFRDVPIEPVIIQSAKQL